MVDGWMNRWTDGFEDGWMDGWIYSVSRYDVPLELTGAAFGNMRGEHDGWMDEYMQPVCTMQCSYLRIQ
jgi:hypothetical protein